MPRHATCFAGMPRPAAQFFAARRFGASLAPVMNSAGELRSDTSGTGAHRLLPWPKSVLSWTIGPCRWEGARAIRRRVVSGNYRNKPSKTETTPATIKTQTIPAGDWKTSIIAPSFDLISPNPRQPQSGRPLKSVVRRSIERSFGDFD